MRDDGLAPSASTTGSGFRGRGEDREALGIRVDTIRYRVDRIQALSGRDLSRLGQKADLRAALLCR
ncbi:helix-turn-helix domain-containing protein [Streptomyces sp. NPDC004788]